MTPTGSRSPRRVISGRAFAAGRRVRPGTRTPVPAARTRAVNLRFGTSSRGVRQFDGRGRAAAAAFPGKRARYISPGIPSGPGVPPYGTAARDSGRPRHGLSRAAGHAVYCQSTVIIKHDERTPMTGKVISVDARTGKERREIGAETSVEEVAAICARAAEAFPVLRDLGREERARLLEAIAAELEAVGPELDRRRRRRDRPGRGPAHRRAGADVLPVPLLRRGDPGRRLPRGGDRPRRPGGRHRPGPTCGGCWCRSARSRCSAPRTSRSRSACRRRHRLRARRGLPGRGQGPPGPPRRPR